MRTRATGIAAVVLAVIALALGLVLKNQSDFSKNYLKHQLNEHGITFTAADNLQPAQKKIPCLVKNAGKLMSTGKQAECYAKYQIGLDMTFIDQGKTYFQDHYNGYLMRVKAATAQAKAPGTPETLKLQEAAQRQDRISDDLLAGEATRGLLLTGYGFSIIGDRIGQAAVAMFVLAALLVVAGAIIIVLSSRRAETRTT